MDRPGPERRGAVRDASGRGEEVESWGRVRVHTHTREKEEKGGEGGAAADGPPQPVRCSASLERLCAAGSAAGFALRCVQVEKPNFGLSGALAGDVRSGTVHAGVTLKWSEPAEGKRPDKKWMLFCFKDGKEVEAPLKVYAQSAYLFGRERRVADIPTDHPSCSSQHAVLQYRYVPLPQEPGDMAPPTFVVKPYIMDLESTNGTFLNGERIEPARYIELRPQDVLRFGLSTREYVLMHAEMAQK